MAYQGAKLEPKWTRSKIEAPPRVPPRLTEFDDIDCVHTVIPNSGSTSAQALEAGRVPNYLLLVSLLEHLCSVYERDPERSNQIFNVLCQQLARMKVMPSFSFLEEFSVIRAKYKTAFRDLLQAAASNIGTDGFPRLPAQRPFFASSFMRFHHDSGPLSRMQDLLQCSTSRYKEEFVEINRLGKGGFGSVFKVKNKLDGREYAVKKIPLKETNPELCLKVLREVKVLAHLGHANVVGYHAAWLEYVASECPAAPLHRVSTHPTSLMNMNGASSKYRINENSDSVVFDHGEPSTSGGIVFAAGSTEGLDSSSHQGNFNLGSASDQKTRRGSDSRIRKLSSTANLKSSASISRNSCAPYQSSTRRFPRSVSSSNLSAYSHKGSQMGDENFDFDLNTPVDLPTTGCKKLGIVLFIQMQLCTTTLRSWLVKRNEDITSKGVGVDKCRNQEIFRQIVDGVQYIHSQGLMHRDLKPRNIFLQSNGTRNGEVEKVSPLQVKIGDFGLARKEVVMSPGESSPLASLIEPLTPLFPTAPSKDMPTAGVGTCTYASPEQLRNNNVYDNKADIYSLGIILFEMFCPFTTEMERVKSIKDLRQGKVPPDFAARWPEEAALILQMVAENPSKRPSAEKILEMEGFCCGNEVTKQLNEKVQEQAEEIRVLQREVIEKDEDLELQGREIEELKKQLAERNEMVNQLLARTTICNVCSKELSIEMEIPENG